MNMNRELHPLPALPFPEIMANLRDFTGGASQTRNIDQLLLKYTCAPYPSSSLELIL